MEKHLDQPSRASEDFHVSPAPDSHHNREIGETAPDQLLQDAARFAVHPDFAEAEQTYCIELARLREAPWLLNAIIATDARWRIMGYLLYLAADTQRFGPNGGATYGRMLHLCTHRQEANPRVLKTLLGLLKLSALVRVVQDERDGRIRYYQPTPRLDRFIRGWIDYAVAALDLLDPTMQRARYVDDPAFIARFNVSGGRAHLADAIPLADRMPEPLATMKTMLGSFSVIIGIMEAELCGRAPPSTARLAWRFGLSRAQVRNVLVAGCEAGLFASSKAGDVRATPTLRQNFAQWISIELAFYARHMRPPGEPMPPIADDLF